MTQPSRADDELHAKREGERPRGGGGEESRARRLIATGAVVSVLGIAVSDMVTHTFGGVLLVVGWAFLILGLHAFGRAGEPAVVGVVLSTAVRTAERWREERALGRKRHIRARYGGPRSRPRR